MNLRRIKRDSLRKERWSVATGLSELGRFGSQRYPANGRFHSMGDSISTSRGFLFVRRWVRRGDWLVPTDWRLNGRM